MTDHPLRPLTERVPYEHLDAAISDLLDVGHQTAAVRPLRCDHGHLLHQNCQRCDPTPYPCDPLPEPTP